jgi:hypothetical protein
MRGAWCAVQRGDIRVVVHVCHGATTNPSTTYTEVSAAVNVNRTTYVPAVVTAVTLLITR